MNTSSSPDTGAADGPVCRRLVVSSQHRHVETVVDWVEELAREHGISDDLLDRLLVAASEAVSNSLCHGNQLNPIRDVVIELCFRQDRVEIVVEDEGGGFDPERLDDPLAEENLWKEGGRGVYLMEQLSDEVQFEEEGCRVCMNFHR